ncbi:LOW QUALITY PROTEIN: nose resistant to fluoxetine protein 6-like [Liolophura sinensis]|uniref:LOW QUALITY PROTEIN: nose resistant to fluoxetine protein 6-like n=1 Tax=Liolophura sinensis TaxID=3198878 RepID=UPI003158A6AF
MKCLYDVSIFLEHLRNVKKSPWALQMVDAQGKLPSGVLEGDLRWPGSYEQCLNITAYTNVSGQGEEELFRGKYCVATIHKGNQSLPAQQTLTPTTPALSLGLCLPDSCSESDVTHLVYLELFPVDIFLNRTDINTEVACPEPLSMGKDGRAIVAIIICSLLAALILIGTLYDICFIQVPVFLVERAQKEHSLAAGDLPNSDPHLGGSENVHLSEKTPLLGNRNVQTDHVIQGRVCQFLLAFSIYSNGAKILSTKQGSSSLRCLNGIRFLSMTWVILGHSYAFGLGVTKNVASLFQALIPRWSFLAIMNGTYSVDSFFFLSGLLVTYLCMKEMDKKKGNLKINWAMFYFHRFWRLTPPYMLVLMFDTCLFRYLGDGPFWPQQGVEKDFCANSWWTNLLYINNFFPIENMCMAWSWYLANDMQFFIISPLILIPLYRSGKLGGSVLMALLFICLLTTGVISRTFEIGVGFTNVNAVDESFNKIYITPWCRIGPYLIGMAVGYFLYKYNSRIYINKWLVMLGWAIAAICCLSVLYGVYDTYHGHPMNLDTAALYNSVSRTVWAVGLGWLVIACCTGYGGFVNTFLSWNAFIPLSRLTYCAYLIHPLVMYYYYFSQRTPVYGSDLNEIYIFLGNAVMSYGLAFIVSLVFEAPFMGLEKAMFAREKKCLRRRNMFLSPRNMRFWNTD